MNATLPSFRRWFSRHPAIFCFGAFVISALTTRADLWEARAPVPGARAAHSAVWTGRELIVWGGGVDGSFLNTGGRYLPGTDSWRTTSLSNAPSPRWFHAAVWTGYEMIIWGGRPNFFGNDNLSDGARYNPATDTWTPMSTQGAPTGRSQCAAVWTGSEMIVWGGETEGGVPLADGARYDPVSDTWRPIPSNGLEPRMEPAAIWTGSEMIIFGGVDATTPGWLSFGNGARYNPATATWRPLPAEGAPSSRTGHTAVWTGERMIVWGGYELPSRTLLNAGASFDPGANAWTSLSVSDASPGRLYHAAVWTGTEMIVWGGQDTVGTILDTGARYKPASGTWTATTQESAPRKRQFWRPDLGIWTGAGMLICAGSDYPASLNSTFLYFNLTNQLPVVTTLAADQLTTNSARLRGQVNPRGPTAAWFEWGTNTTYGNLIGMQDVGQGSSVSNLNVVLDGLMGGPNYHYRLVATNAFGAVYGADQTFNLAQVNYAVSGNTAYVAYSPNASGDVVIASTYNGYPVTGIEGFSGATNLTSVTIPNSVTSIGYYAFSGCPSLTSVTIGNGVTSIGVGAFSGSTSLTNLSVAAANPVYSSLDGVLFNKAQTTLIIFPPGRGGSYVIPDSVTSIGGNAFNSCTSLTSVTIGNSVTNTGVSAFSGCTSLTNVTIPNNVIGIGNASFSSCTSLTRVTIPNSVTRIGYEAFMSCTKLTNFTFLGNAPVLIPYPSNSFSGRWFANVGAGAKVYYYCGTTGWGTNYGGLPTVMLCPPGMAPGSAGVKLGGFGFTVTRLTNQTIVVEASTNLLNWQPIWTNTPPGASTNFVDPEWVNNPNRFYRARSN